MEKKTVQDKPKTTAEKIWEDIKDRQVEMFALPNQLVSNYCKPATVEPTRLYLLSSASALLPALEVALGKEYNVELMNKYIVVTKK